MDTALISALGVFAALVIGLIILKPGWEPVLEEERVVIYRLGHFNRIDGPGPVFLWRQIDVIQRRFTVREQPTPFTVDNLLINGTPLSLTFSIWAAFDPLRAVGDDRAAQVRLVTFSDYERSTQFITLLRAAVVQELAALERRFPVPAEAAIGDKILPIMPGLPPCNGMLDNVRTRITADALSIGFFVNPERPFQLAGFKLPDSVSKGFDRGRTMSFLRAQFPNLADEVLAQLCAAVEKFDLPTIQRLTVQNAGEAAIQIEQRNRTAQGSESRVKMAVPPTAGQSAAAAQPTAAASPAAESAAPPASELRPGDLTVLKRVPRAPSQRKAA